MPKFTRKLKRSLQNLSYRNFLSWNIGDLTPCYAEDILPADTIVIRPQVAVRFAPMVWPILQSMRCRVDYFFVPSRLMWKDWEEFITGGPDGTDVTPYPTITTGTFSITGDTAMQKVLVNGSLLDYIGYPTQDTSPTGVSDLNDLDPLLVYAYHKVYDDWYRDETLQSQVIPDDYDVQDMISEINSDLALSPIVTTKLVKFLSLHKKNWFKDYFTTASPNAQRGDDVFLLNPLSVRNADGTNWTGTSANLSIAPGSDVSSPAPVRAFSQNLRVETTINDLYKLEALQNWLTHNVAGGSRYIEQIRSHFHVISSDARLQRSQLIGSCTFPIQIKEITQTSESNVTPLGQYAGQGSIIGNGHKIKFTAEEHGYIIGIIHIAPTATYFQGIRKNWLRRDRFDYFWPEFQNLGQQEVLNKEIYHPWNVQTTGVFGYQSRFAEYKFHADELHGSFRGTMLDWTMARKFANLPSLNGSFLEVDNYPDGNNRVFVNPSATETLYGLVNNQVSAYRYMLPYEPISSGHPLR